jgi:hypothetical protein
MDANSTLEAVRDLVSPDVRREVLSGAEAARMLGLSPRTIWTLAKQGHLVRVQLPGRKRSFGYSRASVEKLAAVKSGGVA